MEKILHKLASLYGSVYFWEGENCLFKEILPLQGNFSAFVNTQKNFTCVSKYCFISGNKCHEGGFSKQNLIPEIYMNILRPCDGHRSRLNYFEWTKNRFPRKICTTAMFLEINSNLFSWYFLFPLSERHPMPLVCLVWGRDVCILKKKS